MIIDTHVHYNLEPLLSHREEYWQKAQAQDVLQSIIVGTDFITSNAALKIAETEAGLYASIGVHPTEYQEVLTAAKADNIHSFDVLFEEIQTDIDQLTLLTKFSKVVAIGETGLDYFHLPKDLADQRLIIELQKDAFLKHIQLAKKQQLPLIIHVRDKEIPEEKKTGNAYWDALEILQKDDVKKFTLHCVSGPLSYVKAAIEMGGHMGFDGNITYPNARHIREIFQIVPADRRLVETDAPFLPPQEFRGQTCEPWMIAKTVEYIEQELKVERDTFAQNAQRLFNLK